MPVAPTRSFARLLPAMLLLAALALWLRWPGFGHSLWNVDEAIHAAAGRTLLDGGVLYRDVVDQRTPVSYYAFAAVFALCGENNLWAVRGFVALLIVATAACLFLAGRRLAGAGAGLAAGVLYVLLGATALHPGDANAANTEWFAAFFASAGTAVFLTGDGAGLRRPLAAGLLFGFAFLSKQPALLEAAAPLAALAYGGGRPTAGLARQAAAFAAGWLAPVSVTALGLMAAGAWDDALFYTWTYNLAYYGPEVDATGRLAAAFRPFQLIGAAQPWLLALWVVGALRIIHRLMQRAPTSDEAAGNPGRLLLAVWTLAGLAAAAAGGRDYDHYTIHFLPAFCLGAGMAAAGLPGTRSAERRFRRLRTLVAAGVLGLATYDAATGALVARARTLPHDPSQRVASYIRAHSTPADRIFVWGFHPDIYLFADRRPASRFVYASFLSGLVPWTNTEPGRDTAYAIVPGARETLLADLAARPPAFIVDCSAGPNRHWQKYPLDTFPGLRDLVARDYLPVDPGQFVPQGFRLFRRRQPGEVAPDSTVRLLPEETLATLAVPTLGPLLAPVRGSAPLGTHRSVVDGRLEYFAHAPSLLTYRIPPGSTGLRGGFGMHAAAYAIDNAAPTDGAEFVIRWRPATGREQVLLRRLLRPREIPADRDVQSFQVSFPQPAGGGELDLEISPGPAGVPASDWTYWTDLMLENSR